MARNSLRWRRNRNWAVVCCLALIALVAAFGRVRVSAVTSRSEGRATSTAPARTVPAGQVAIFDDAVVHEISVQYEEADYDRAIEAYQSQGLKDYIEARLEVDGTTLKGAGLRLKGNSTLRGLRGGRGFGAPGGGGGPGAGGGGPAFGGFAGFGRRATADEPHLLPWLLSFDAFLEDQRYQGLESLAVRAASRPTTETSLNEALALRLIDLAGEPAERAAYTSFRVNGEKPVLRLLVENPEGEFAERSFRGKGVLYKAESGGRFTYLGDDPLSYGEAFRQITGKKEHDLKPLIDLMRWESEADDEDFAAQLADRLDVRAFARYAALQNLLLNFDDMAGPGQNYYLWYSLADRKFRVVTWDMNLAFSGQAGQGPFEAGGFRGRGGHPLKERFLATPPFRDLYLKEYRLLHEKLLVSGVALRELDRLAKVVEGSALVDAATVKHETDLLRNLLKERQASLAESLKAN